MFLIDVCLISQDELNELVPEDEDTDNEAKPVEKQQSPPKVMQSYNFILNFIFSAHVLNDN